MKKNITVYDLKDIRIKIWTTEGFRFLKKIYEIKDMVKVYEIKIDKMDNLYIPEFMKIKTLRGYIPVKDIIKEEDVAVCHSDKNMNVLRVIEDVFETDWKSDHWIIIETEDSPVVRTFSLKENDEYYAVLDKEGKKGKKKLKEIKENDFVQVGDEFKKVICKKNINEEEGIIILNMNNNLYFLNDVAVIPDIEKIRNLKDEHGQNI
jgi:hypothetical protein